MFTIYEKSTLITSLLTRRNVIETGNIAVSAADVEKMGEHTNNKINALSTDQMQLIIDTEALIIKLFKP